MTQQPEKGKITLTTEDTTAESTSSTDYSHEQSLDDTQTNGPENGRTAQEELQIFQDKYLRLAAEFENYKHPIAVDNLYQDIQRQLQ